MFFTQDERGHASELGLINGESEHESDDEDNEIVDWARYTGDVTHSQ